MLPSELMSSIVAKAKSLKRTIVLPDATDERAIQAARILADKSIAQPVLIGKASLIQDQARKSGTALAGIRIIDPETSDRLSDFSHIYFNLRKAKGIEFTEAQKAVTHPLFFGAMMVREGRWQRGGFAFHHR